MTNFQDRFLEAEKEASLLVNELKLLKNEIQETANRNKVLEQYSTDFKGIGSSLTQLASRFKDYIGQLGELDPSELFTRFDKLDRELDEVKRDQSTWIIRGVALSGLACILLLVNIVILLAGH